MKRFILPVYLHIRCFFTCLSAMIIFFLFSFFAYSQDGNSALMISGRNLTDSCGETVLLRGVNHGNIWTSNFGTAEFPEIAKTGANCVRICLERTYTYYSQGVPYIAALTGDIMDSIIQRALDQKLIPIVELHDFTDGFSDNHNDIQRNMDSAVMFWTKPTIMNVLKKHSRFLILNIANEPEHWENTEKKFFDACSSAIAAIRVAGLKVPIMLDGMLSAQDEKFFMNNGQGAKLLEGDPEHKLLFSVHTYWHRNDVPDNELSNRFNNMFNSNLPFVIGEFAYDIGDSCKPTINYRLIMELCQQYKIGYLYWWWGFIESSSNNCLSMTHTGTFQGLANEGLEAAVTNQNSIQSTSVKSSLILFNKCSFGGIVENIPDEVSVSPNPNDGSFTISSKIEPVHVKLIDILGNEISLTNSSPASFSFNPSYSGLYIIIISLSDKQHIIKKLIVRNNSIFN